MNKKAIREEQNYKLAKLLDLTPTPHHQLKLKHA